MGELCSTYINNSSLQNLNTSLLEYIDISSCKSISDQLIIDTISKCEQLKVYIGRSLKQLTRKAYKHLFNSCHKLTTVYMSNCFVDENVNYSEWKWRQTTTLPSLQVIDLSNNTFLSDEMVIALLKRLTAVSWIDLSNCTMITHQIIPHICSFKHTLTHLALSNCSQLQSSQLVQLNQLYKLECLYISSSTISNGELSELLSQLDQLMDLSIMNCKSIEDVPMAIQSIIYSCKR